MKYCATLGVLVVLFVVLNGCAAVNIPSFSPSATSTPTVAQPRFGMQAKTTGCVVRGALPDAACTPGAIFPNATKADICRPGYARSVRNVPQSVKNQVYAEYGITRRVPGQYEVDHLVNLSLGGSKDIANLWPEAAKPKPGFHEKDRVENYLHDQVCAGAIDLKQAQIEIATDWLAVYRSMPSNVPCGSNEGQALLHNQGMARPPTYAAL